VLHLDAKDEHIKSSILDQNMLAIFDKNGVETFNSIFLETDMTEKTILNMKQDFSYLKHTGKISSKLDQPKSPDYLAFVPLSNKNQSTT